MPTHYTFKFPWGEPCIHLVSTFECGIQWMYQFYEHYDYGACICKQHVSGSLIPRLPYLFNARKKRGETWYLMSHV